VRFRHVAAVLGLYLLAPGGNEYSNLELSRVESEQARERHWPAGWGQRPVPGGYYVVPVPADARLQAPAVHGDTALTRAPTAPPIPAPAAAPPISSPATGQDDAVAAAAAAPAPAAEAPLVSVVIPTRDREAWLRRALESVAGQTHPRVEAIVVNDAGADVGALIAELQARVPVTYVRLARHGERSAARNAGLALARGTYVAYLDDDDWYHPEHLATLVAALESGPAAVAYSDAHRVLEEPQGTTYVTRGMDVPYSVDFDGRRLQRGNYIPMLCVMHRRDCLARVGGFDETLSTHEDWELLLRLARVFDFVHVPRVTCAFSWRTDGSSTTSERQADFARTAAIIRARCGGAAAGAEVAGGADRGGAAVVRQCGTGPYTCSIVVPVFNKVELTMQCLAALAAVTGAPDFEVIVVDNGSTDDTPAFLEKLGGDVQVIRNAANEGFARACNQGAARARGRYLVFLNNDTIPLEGWLAPLVAEVERDPTVMAVGSKLLYADGTIQHAGVAFSRVLRTPYHIYQRAPSDAPEVNRRRELQAVTAACVLVRREEFGEIGGFDEGFRNSFEDVDLCLRLRERGGRVVYQPASVLVHLESQSAGRHDHDAQNGRRLRERWQHRCLEDEDVVYAEDGHRVQSAVVDGQIALRLGRATDEAGGAAWAHLVAIQKLALAGDLPGVATLLEDPARWPADVLALQWAAGLCERAGCVALAPAYLRRILALAELPDVRALLEDLEGARTHGGSAQQSA
jgi:GT2 family glycosyltransferase